MFHSQKSRSLLGMLSVSTTGLFALAAVAATQHTTATAGTKSPERVAALIDGIIQPRFQQSAGQFGEDRVIGSLDGHPGIDEMYQETPHERAVLNVVRRAGRSYVIGILHCAHKPGHHANMPKDQDSAPDPVTTPTYEALVSTHTTDRKAVKAYDWANDHLTPVVAPFAKALRGGKPRQTVYGDWVVVMQPIRAEHRACLSCHAGAKRGDTLGVMVYSVNQKVTGDKLSHVWTGGGV